MTRRARPFVLGGILFIGLQMHGLGAAEWAVPMAGNTFRTAPAPGGRGVRRSGVLAWSDQQARYSTFFRVDRGAKLRLSLRARVLEGPSKIEVLAGNKTFRVELEGADFATKEIGHLGVSKAGYVRVEFRGLERTGKGFAEIRELIVASENEGLKLDYVRTNKGGMFYWGRRGPSVHLRYDVPRGRDLKYAYSEITVPKGEDPIGSFFMANGFGQGYFGIQVNSAKERRVLFSVWSPFKTDNPREVPKDQRIVDLGHGGDSGSRPYPLAGAYEETRQRLLRVPTS